MGRSFESVSMGVKEVSARWIKASRALKEEDQVYALELRRLQRSTQVRRIMRWMIPGGCVLFRAGGDDEEGG